MNTWLLFLLFGGAAILLVTSVQAMLGGGDDAIKRRLEALKRAGGGDVETPDWAKAIAEEEAKQRVDLRGALTRVAGIGVVEKIERQLAGADIKMRVSEWVLVRLVLVVGPLAIGVGLLKQPFLGVGLAAAGYLVPGMLVGARRKARVEKFNNQLAEFLTLLVNALRAGQTFLQAIDRATQDSPEPIRSEFKLLLNETGLGLPVEAAFQNLIHRVPSQDLEITGTAFIIQKNIGGNLAEVMEKVAYTIRERVKIQGQIKVMTAQGILSGILVGGLPIALVCVLYFLNPSYISLLFTTPKGQMLLAGGLALEVIGALVIKKIVTIEV